MRTGEALWIVVVLCSIALAYFAWRIRLWRSRSKWSRTLLPRSGQLSWKVPPSEQRTGRTQFDEVSASRYSLSGPGEKNGSDQRKHRAATPAQPKRSSLGSSAPDAALAPLARSPLWQGLTRKPCTQFKPPLPNNSAAWIPSATTSEPTFTISLRRVRNHGCSAWRTTLPETPSRSHP